MTEVAVLWGWFGRIYLKAEGSGTRSEPPAAETSFVDTGAPGDAAAAAAAAAGVTTEINHTA